MLWFFPQNFLDIFVSEDYRLEIAKLLQEVSVGPSEIITSGKLLVHILWEEGDINQDILHEPIKSTGTTLSSLFR